VWDVMKRREKWRETGVQVRDERRSMAPTHQSPRAAAGGVVAARVPAPLADPVRRSARSATAATSARLSAAMSSASSSSPSSGTDSESDHDGARKVDSSASSSDEDASAESQSPRKTRAARHRKTAPAPAGGASAAVVVGLAKRPRLQRAAKVTKAPTPESAASASDSGPDSDADDFESQSVRARPSQPTRPAARKSARAPAATQAEDDGDESLFTTVANGRAALKAVVEDWKADYAEDSGKALATLLTFFVRACGCTKAIPSSIVMEEAVGEHIDGLVEHFEEGDTYPIKNTHDKVLSHSVSVSSRPLS
jgi:hypothetical protein